MNFNQPILVFDIETIPDLASARHLSPELNDLPDDEAMTALIAKREAEAGNAFMPYPLHKIACLSVLWVNVSKKHYRLRSLSLDAMDEKEILTKFLNSLTQNPILVSWNGKGFDVPVLGYRSLHHRLSAPKLFSEHRGGYLDRYGNTHIDVMEKLKFGSFSNSQKLDLVSALCGVAGKGGTDGSQVLPMVQNGEWDKLCRYCESDVLNTWFLFLYWQKLTGKLKDDDAYAIEQDTLSMLATLSDDTGHSRHQAFLSDNPKPTDPITATDQ